MSLSFFLEITTFIPKQETSVTSYGPENHTIKNTKREPFMQTYVTWD